MLKRHFFQILLCCVAQSFLYGMDLQKALESQNQEAGYLNRGDSQPVVGVDTPRVRLFGDEVFEEFEPSRSGNVASKKRVHRSKKSEKVEQFSAN